MSIINYVYILAIYIKLFPFVRYHAKPVRKLFNCRPTERRV